jgi:hypothetical protein
VAKDGALPTLVVAGVSKAGTTSVFDVLSRHPDVCPSSTKETRHFQAVRHGEPLPPLDAYRAYFRACHGEPVVMECTPDYIYGGRATAQAIADACAPQVLMVLRDPVDRLVSFFRFLRARLQLPAEMTLADYVQRCRAMPDDVMNDRAANPWTGLWGGHYARFLADWYDVHGDRMRVAFFDDLVGDPSAFFDQTCTWLGIDPARLPSVEARTDNATVAYRSPALQRTAARLARMGRPVLHFHPRLAQRARSAYQAANERPAAPEPVSPELRGRLVAHYAVANDELRSLLSSRGVSPLPPWLAPG